MKLQKLTGKQPLFVQYYLQELNGTKAALLAGYSKKTAAAISGQNMRKPHILAAIEAGKHKRAEKVEIDANWVLERAARLADFNINKFITVNNHGVAVYDFSGATDADWYCVSEYSTELLIKARSGDQVEVEKIKLKTFDKLKALELVARHQPLKYFDQGDADKTNAADNLAAAMMAMFEKLPN